jgi:quercetin dioxygenase-like cupin family protein
MDKARIRGATGIRQVGAIQIEENKLKDRNDMSSSGAYARSSNLNTTSFYMGSLMSFLAKGEETDGRFALMEFRSKPGNEPPPHVHEWEHEIFYILGGAMEFYIEERIFQAKAGEVVFVPRGAAHGFSIRSEQLHALILVVATGEQRVGLDNYFLELSEPATAMSLPADAITYAIADPEHAVAAGARNGLRILSDDEVIELIPCYPGLAIR